MINEIKREMQEDDFNEAMGDSLFEIDDLF
jgi:hypothetical protein